MGYGREVGSIDKLGVSGRVHYLTSDLGSVVALNSAPQPTPLPMPIPRNASLTLSLNLLDSTEPAMRIELPDHNRQKP
nr:hypothetical protein Itr_chr13CG18280 [Ipomoea trifida]